MNRHRRPLLALLVLVSVTIHASPAAAHAEVRESDPPADGIAPTGQDEVSITFITMDPDVPPEIDVLDPDGDTVSTGEPEVTARAPTGTTVQVPVRALDEGVHRVRWRAMSSDGDGLSTGTFEFTVEASGGGGAGTWLLWIVVLAVPAVLLLRTGAAARRRRGHEI